MSKNCFATQAIGTVRIPQNIYPWIRGPANENLDHLQRQYKVKINIPLANSDKIVINGEHKNVYKVVQILKQIYDSKKNVAAITCSIPRVQHRYILGIRHSGLDEILRQTDVVVEIPPQNENSDVIMLRGETSKLSAALSLVYQRATSIFIKEIKCEKWQRHLLIDVKGAPLQSLVPNYKNLKIDFENDGVILLEGPPEQVNKASEALENEIGKLSNGHRSEIIDQKLNHHAIEKHDTLEPKLKNENGVKIDIPDESNHTFSTNNITSDKTIRTRIKNIQAIIDDLVKQANQLEERMDQNECNKDFYEAIKSLFKQCNDLLKKFDITLKWNSKANELDTLQEANISKNLMKQKTTDPYDGVQRDDELNTKIDSNVESKFGLPSFIFLIDGRFGVETYENGTTKMLKNIFNNDWTPLYLSMAEKSIEIGEIAKSHFHDFPNFVIYDILKIIGKPINEIKIDPKWGFEIIENNGIVFFQIETQNGKRMIPEEMILAAFFKTMKFRTEKYLNENIKEIYLSTNFKISESQRNIFKKAALKVNLEIKTFDFIDYE